MSELQLPAVESQQVEMIYLGQRIGSGTLTIHGTTIAIDTPFEWPPDAIAIVEGRFQFIVLDEKTCSVGASYPGLLRQDINAPHAEYFVFLIGARPQYNIITPDGDRLVFSSIGPFSDPERVVGYELGIQAAGQHPLSFIFRIV